MCHPVHSLNRQSRLLHPALWHVSLGRAFLATGDAEAIAAMVRLCAFKIGKGPAEEYEEIVCKVLEDIHQLSHQHHPNRDQVNLSEPYSVIFMELCNSTKRLVRTRIVHFIG